MVIFDRQISTLKSSKIVKTRPHTGVCLPPRVDSLAPSLLPALSRSFILKTSPLPRGKSFTYTAELSPSQEIDGGKTENMTAAQMKAYLEALDEEEDQNAAAFMRLALATGMRKSALLGLRWQDIDFEYGFITLRGEFAKKGKTERIPLSAAARAILKGIERLDDEFVFPGRYGGPRKEFKKIAQRVKEKAGLPADFRPLHGLRHTFASWLASSGEVDLYTLQKLLTHNSPQMTQRYAHLADSALQRAASVADKLFSEVVPEPQAASPDMPGVKGRRK